MIQPLLTYGHSTPDALTVWVDTFPADGCIRYPYSWDTPAWVRVNYQRKITNIKEGYIVLVDRLELLVGDTIPLRTWFQIGPKMPEKLDP